MPRSQHDRVCLGHAILAYLEAVSNPRYKIDQSYMLQVLADFFGENTSLHSITNNDAALFILEKSKPYQKNGKPFVRSASTINRYMGLLSIVINHVKTQGYAVPNIDFGKHKLKEPDHRIRYLSTSEAE